MAIVHVSLNNYIPYMHTQMARNFTLKTTKEDLKMIEQLAMTVDEDVPLYFTDKN